MRYMQLGASLYVPATRADLAEIANGRKYTSLRSVVFCTEDAVRESDVPAAIETLRLALQHFEPVGMLRFIRPRNPHILRALLKLDGIANVTGFVLPKVTQRNVSDYFSEFAPDQPFETMITLETAEVFEPGEMTALRDLLLTDAYRRRVLSLRIGGNDLFKLLGMRRPRTRSVYDTPLGVTISNLVTTFRPYGFNLTAPVFEYLDCPNALASEVERDLEHGLCGKTAIHPDQVPIIEALYRVRRDDLEMARRILDESAPAVFRLSNSMCEPATHRAWAAMISERARLFGIHDDREPAGMLTRWS